MSELEANLVKLYVPLIAWVGLGGILGAKLPRRIPFYLGKGLFWVGVPLSILTFLRQADLSESIWIVPAVAWVAILLGAGFAWLWITIPHSFKPPHHSSSVTDIAQENHLSQLSDSSPDGDRPTSSWSSPTQGSFLLSAMVGNTGYLGYPVTLTLVGTKYFAWAIFYDTLGSTLGAYGLGVALASQFGVGQQSRFHLLQAVFINPAFWSFWVGLGFRQVALPLPIERTLQAAAWTVIALSLLLLGMRLSQVSSWQNVQKASVSLSIKMIIVPLIVGFSLPWLGITGTPQLVIVLQMAMPPAFATLVIAEAYNLDRDLTVTTLALGSIGILATLPIWLWLF
jgi:predicted permease